MKIVRYEWEDNFLFVSLNKSLNEYDNFNSSNLFDKINIKSSLETNKNIDFAKVLSFSFLFNSKKSFVFLKENNDKNPLKLKSNNKKSINSYTIIGEDNRTMINVFYYVYLIYLVNILRDKNIKFSNKFSSVYNPRIVELNSIFKIGHLYNVIDIDPSIELSFIGLKNPKILEYYIK